MVTRHKGTEAVIPTEARVKPTGIQEKMSNCPPASPVH